MAEKIKQQTGTAGGDLLLTSKHEKQPHNEFHADR